MYLSSTFWAHIMLILLMTPNSWCWRIVRNRSLANRIRAYRLVKLNFWNYWVIKFNVLRKDSDNLDNWENNWLSWRSMTIVKVCFSLWRENNFYLEELTCLKIDNLLRLFTVLWIFVLITLLRTDWKRWHDLIRV